MSSICRIFQVASDEGSEWQADERGRSSLDVSWLAGSRRAVRCSEWHGTWDGRRETGDGRARG
jgi:hypothetical protein